MILRAIPKKNLFSHDNTPKIGEAHTRQPDAFWSCWVPYGRVMDEFRWRRRRRRPSRAMADHGSRKHQSASLEDVSSPERESSVMSGNGSGQEGLRVTRLFTNGERVEDVVSLDNLGALISRRPGRAIALAWEPKPKTVLVVATPHSQPARYALPVVVATLRRFGCKRVLVETDEMANLVAKPEDDHPPSMPPPTLALLSDVEEDGRVERGNVDVVICLGGDGLILHVVSALFPHAVPPIMPFNLGSLGFLTPFSLDGHEASIARVLEGRNKTVTMRMRLRGLVVPKGTSLGRAEPPCPPHGVDDVINAGMKKCTVMDPRGGTSSETQSKSVLLERSFSDGEHGYVEQSEQLDEALKSLTCHHVLNEIVIDRGPAPYLCNIEVFADDCEVTRVQADGLILATPTGSTAYSLSSGGSMVHPSVPAILFTPICPHSLSFRPVLFPHDVVLHVKIPEDARASAWVSFDGRHRMELQRGDKIVVWASQYPVPTFSAKDPTTDWFASVSHCLRWNERAQQSSFGARDRGDS